MSKKRTPFIPSMLDDNFRALILFKPQPFDVKYQ
jgi:hypothetical protein